MIKKHKPTHNLKQNVVVNLPSFPQLDKPKTPPKTRNKLFVFLIYFFMSDVITPMKNLHILYRGTFSLQC